MTREETIESLQSIIEENRNCLMPRVHIGFLIHAVKYLKEQNEIVRCKDCKHRGEWSCAVCIDELFETADNWYCADGERKEGW